MDNDELLHLIDEKGMNDLAKRLSKESAERTLKVKIDDDAFDLLEE